MFNAQQLAYLRALASQSAGNAQIGFNRTRLLVRIGPTDDDWSASMLFIFLAGILLVFGLVVAYRGHRLSWALLGSAAGASQPQQGAAKAPKLYF
jgi:hypothetical protein